MIEISKQRKKKTLFVSKLAKIRRDKEIERADMASQLGMTYSALARLEQSRALEKDAKYDDVMRICKFLGVQPEDIISDNYMK